jgi:hypothetical protein
MQGKPLESSSTAESRQKVIARAEPEDALDTSEPAKPIRPGAMTAYGQLSQHGQREIFTMATTFSGWGGCAADSRPHLGTAALPAGCDYRLLHLAVLRVAGPEPATGVFRDQNRLDEDTSLCR